MASPQLVEPGSVKILEEVDTRNAVKQKSSATSDKRKSTPVKDKESTKDKSAKSSSLLLRRINNWMLSGQNIFQL